MRIFLAFICMFFSVAAHAKAIMVVTPTPITSGTIPLAPSQGQVVVYNVTNNTNTRTLDRFTIYPAFGTHHDAASAVSVISNDCTTALAPGASCSFRIRVLGGVNLPASFMLSPRVCAYSVGTSAAVCSQPAAANRMRVATNNKRLYAFVANDFSTGVNNLTRCEVLSNGDFSNCTTILGGFSNPYGLAFNSNLTTTPSMVYVTNYNSDTISPCAVSSNGVLNCSPGVDPNSNFSSPNGNAINSDGTLLYVSNESSSEVIKCQIGSNGVLSNCLPTGSNFVGPVGIVMSATETLAYVGNYGGSTVTKCSINSSGDFTCSAGTNPGPFVMNNPAGITLNSAGSRAYVVNSTRILKCDIIFGGDLTNCTVAGLTGNNPRFLVFNADETLAYFTNAGDNTVSKCQVNTLGDLVYCTTTGTNFDGPTGIQLVYL